MQKCLPLTLPRISIEKFGGMELLCLPLHSFCLKIVGRWLHHFMPVSYLKALTCRVLIL